MTGSEDPGIGRGLRDAVLTFRIDEHLCRMSIHVGVHVRMPGWKPRVLPYTRLEITIHTIAPAVSRLRPALRSCRGHRCSDALAREGYGPGM